MEDFVGRRNLIPPERLRELSERSDLAGACQMGSHIAALALSSWALAVTWGSALAIPVFVIQGVLLNYLFAAQHELNHYTAFKTRWPNDFFNRITGFIQIYPRSYERWYHFEHHRHTQDWDNDPELLSRGGPYTLGSYLPYLFGITYWSSRIKRTVMVALGDVPALIKAAMLCGDLHAIERPDGRVRPITVPSFVRKIAMSAVQAVFLDEVRKGVGACQFGVGVRDGVPKAFQALKGLMKEHPDHVIIGVDASGAHSNIRRNVLEKVLEQRQQGRS